MANVLVDENSLSSIANAIREKNGTTTTYKPGEMSAAIQGIQTGGNDGLPYNWLSSSDYGHTIYTTPSSGAYSSLTLPDGVAFEDVVLMMGISAPYSLKEAATVTARTRGCIGYIYCPSMYDANVSISGTTYHKCIGFYSGQSSNSVGTSEWTLGTSIGVDYKVTGGYYSHFPVLHYDSSTNKITIHNYRLPANESSYALQDGYVALGYSNMILVYKNH